MDKPKKRPQARRMGLPCRPIDPPGTTPGLIGSPMPVPDRSCLGTVWGTDHVIHRDSLIGGPKEWWNLVPGPERAWVETRVQRRKNGAKWKDRNI